MTDLRRQAPSTCIIHLTAVDWAATGVQHVPDTRHPLQIVHARENNLKELSIEIPHDRIVAVTGLSGSGKSSLAFDTVYAEGQRRYIETFSPYTRQFLDKVKKPDVDHIGNVRPAIAIQQRVRITNSRSTVGSVTSINDYLKILWSALAEAFCPTCEIKLRSWTPDSLAIQLRELHQVKPDSTFLLGFPVLIAGKSKKKALQEEVRRLILLGFNRYFHPENREVCQLDEALLPGLTTSDELLVILDRVKGAAFNQKRIRDVIDQCFSLSRGTLSVIELASETDAPRGFLTVSNNPSQANTPAVRYRRHSFHAAPQCDAQQLRIDRPRPSLFSYNHPLGACPACKGFGRILEVDTNLCVPNPLRSIRDKAIQCWNGDGTRTEFKDLLAFCRKENIPVETPWLDLSDVQKNLILHTKRKDYWGVFPWFQWLERKTYKMHVRVFLARYRSQVVCSQCHGTRLKPDALAYRINGRTLPHIWNITIGDLVTWIEELQAQTTQRGTSSREIDEVLKATVVRLRYLCDLGLEYLTLDRQARTLSGGETQRVNLAAALGSDLVSTHFVLDEPSVGLHARDTQRLIRSIRGLQSRGNSVLVVEHDLDCIESADQIIELGPTAGEGGGQVVFTGPAEQWKGVERRQKLPPRRTLSDFPRTLKITNASARNLKGLSVEVPLDALTVFSGVSGSGKSTLVREVIERRAQEAKIGLKTSDTCDLVSGFDQVDQVIVVDQSSLSKSPRANIATYTGMWDTVRNLLSATDDATIRALSRSSFSFNVDGGRCPHCKGSGFIREDMQFLSDVYVPCDACLGKRFQHKVLEVRYNGLNVHEILQMTLERCTTFFQSIPSIRNAAELLCQLGVGHLSLGHSLSELSGGEAQRLKLIPFIQRGGESSSLLIFDEPTTGLHHYDVEKLIRLLRTLVDRGHSVICIEHNLALVASADWIIDLGPDGGDRGGTLVATGSPHDFLEEETPGETAHYLRAYCNAATAEKSPRKKSPQLTEAPVRQALHLRGAKEHNLKNISLDIPLNELVALTGVSGSGKSSIAKDIVYAEGQRRYLDCLSPYARQFIKELKRPDIESIENVPPTICVYQHTFQPSALSSVGTMSEAYNFLRLLYAKTGIQYCPDHPSERIAPLAPEEIARSIKDQGSRTIRILAPIIKQKKGFHKPIFERAIASEISEVRVDGVYAPPSRFSEGLAKTKPHTIEYVIAKCNPARLDLDMLLEAVQQGLSLSGGTLIVSGEEETVFSTERTCPICQRGFFKVDPEDLSFHSKRGACEKCGGTGRGRGEEPCTTCDGMRLKAIGRNVRLKDKNITQAASLTAPQLHEFLESVTFSSTQEKIAEPVFRELFSKLKSLTRVGLEYLSLNRDCATLSGGELQRLRLGTAMGSPLTSVMYIFDEPSIGLHPNDNERVLAQLHELKDSGNSVIVIEHDTQSILACEHIIDIGPGGGTHGGSVVFEGAREAFLESDSLTAQCIREDHTRLSATLKDEQLKPIGSLTLSKGTRNNIRDLSLTLPLGVLSTVIGVSGAGKSTLVHSLISDTMQLGKAKEQRWTHEGAVITSTLPIERVLLVDQKPIGANSRSTPASYLGIWDEIRKLFAHTIEAKARGWSVGFFSYNTGKGRCPECKGQGQIKLEMSFLPDSVIRCESCDGKRFQDETLTVTYQGLNVHQVLSLTFEQARATFANHRRIHQALHRACELGLGYLTLGQSSSTLSGGESQRLKLVSEMSASRKNHTLYVLDEPTTGLHKSDVSKLMKVLKSLIALGHTVILIEHDMDVICASDHLVELGPGPGTAGGKVIYAGPPEGLIRAKTPWGEILARISQSTPRRKRKAANS